MTSLNQIYKCNSCGQIVTIIHAGHDMISCCDQPMVLQEAHKKDVGVEKHLPVIEKTATGIKVKVGDIPHPMGEDHQIEWIEVTYQGQTHRQFLKPTDAPEADFALQVDDLNQIQAREYCNLHGLWQTN